MYVDARTTGATQQAACPLTVVLEMRRLVLAPQVGLEPTTLRLTATQHHRATASLLFAIDPHHLALPC